MLDEMAEGAVYLKPQGDASFATPAKLTHPLRDNAIARAAAGPVSSPSLECPAPAVRTIPFTLQPSRTARALRRRGVAPVWGLVELDLVVVSPRSRAGPPNREVGARCRGSEGVSDPFLDWRVSAVEVLMRRCGPDQQEQPLAARARQSVPQ